MMKKNNTNKILIVDDDAVGREMIAAIVVRKLGMRAVQAVHGREALEILAREEAKDFVMVLLDLHMPVMGGMETLRAITQCYPKLPVIMITGSRDLNDAVRSIQQGAVDFINKPIEAERLAVTLSNAMRLKALSRQISNFRSARDGNLRFMDVVGVDDGLAASVALGRKAASSDITVLLNGETGTGKEVFARALHGESLRKGKPFVAINCGAIPAQLVESTLFGHEKGAFTGADTRKTGKFREAEGGTIFLDEVGELPLDAQVKLLRVLQQKEVEPVGAGQSVPVNVRIISATNRDLAEEVRKGKFREDLYFRLNIFSIELPPLRNRKQDILQLAEHFMESYGAEYGKIPLSMAPEFAAYICAQDWPGNVRQLENFINKSVVMASANTLEYEASSQVQAAPSEKTAPDDLIIQLRGPHGEIKVMETIEREVMEAVLGNCEGNITKASQMLGIAKSTFYRKMKEQLGS